MTTAAASNTFGFSRPIFEGSVRYATPHCGLPPCRGGGAYAPMTRTII